MKSDWNTIVSSHSGIWDQNQNRSWNFFEVRWRPYSPRKISKSLLFNLNLANEKLGLNLAFKRDNGCATSTYHLGHIQNFIYVCCSGRYSHLPRITPVPIVDDIDLEPILLGNAWSIKPSKLLCGLFIAFSTEVQTRSQSLAFERLTAFTLTFLRLSRFFFSLDG